MNRLAVPLLIAGLCSACADFPLQPSKQEFRGSVAAEGRVGPVSGYVQSSRGGAKAGTSPKRPDLSEVGIDTEISPEISARACWLFNEAWIRARIVDLSGSNTLTKSLTTLTSTFPAGTNVSTDIQVNWYRFGYAQRFELAGYEDKLAITPGIGLSYFDYNYKISGGGMSQSRAFGWAQPYLQVLAEGEIWGPLGFSAELSTTPPVIDSRFSFGFEGRLVYNLWGGADASIGVGYETFDFKDGQGTPNRFNADFGPTGLFGIDIRY